MRAVLLDWVMEVCSEFTLKRETYHLAVSYIDRFLDMSSNTARGEFQLIGLAALFIASKIEEVYPPRISDFAKSAKYGFTHA
jgi:cyclin E